MAVNVKFRGLNRADAFDELAHVDGVPAGLRQIASDAIDKLPDSELEVEFSHDASDAGVTSSVTVKILGPGRRLPLTLSRDQIVELRGQGKAIPRDL